MRCSRIMWNLFNFDYGPFNLLEALHHWKWFTFRHDQLFALKSVIDGVMQRYAHQAAQKKPPMSMADLDLYIKAHLKGLGGRSSLPDDFHFEKDGEASLKDEKFKVPSASATSASGSSASAPELCQQFNRAICPRAPAGAKFCTRTTGEKLYHCCSHKDGKQTICLAFHAKKDHK